MTAFPSSAPVLEDNDSDLSGNSNSAAELLRPSIESVHIAEGQGCAEALVKRGLIADKDEEIVAALISRANHDAVAATNEMLKRSMIGRQDMAVVSEFIKRTIRRHAWGVARPVAVGRAAYNFYQRRQVAELRRAEVSEKRFLESR